MPVKKGTNAKHTGDDNGPDQKLFKFAKDEIVFAKMKFFSAWPAKVSRFFTFWNGVTINLNFVDVFHFWSIVFSKYLTSDWTIIGHYTFHSKRRCLQEEETYSTQSKSAILRQSSYNWGNPPQLRFQIWRKLQKIRCDKQPGKFS